MRSLWLYLVIFLYYTWIDSFQFSVSWLVGGAKLQWSDFNHNDASFQRYFTSQDPSIISWEPMETARRISLISMRVDHHLETNWFMSALHRQYSIGWNRTQQLAFGRRPYSCTVRFIGVALEKTLDGFQKGGTGYITLAFKDTKGKQYWHGFDKNESNRISCYYSTNKDTGSEFLTTPKTLGIAIYCPITLDEEIGPFVHQRQMIDGYYCYPLATYKVDIEVYLFPTDYALNPSSASREIIGEVISSPTSQRQLQVVEKNDHRRHAVCTVQTFCNPHSGPMLYMFVAYYQLMGWRVIVYDRFGMHYEFIKELLHLPGFDYYPFTVYQLTEPSKYNAKYAAKQECTLKSFYKMEVNWGYSGRGIADTADQDGDKTRTYDYVRLEYAHLKTLLFIDTDEIFFCPQSGHDIQSQRQMHHHLHDEFVARGLEEMRYVRIPYSGMAPVGFINTQQNRSNTDFTHHTGQCLIEGYNQRCLPCMMKCWSTGTSYDNFPKSADLAGTCPFHYNHWSCDGMKGGGRDWTKVRCRCKVGFDMQNGFEYRPVLKKCHLMHFNDNKYRFQSKRTKHTYDKGDVTVPCPLVKMMESLPQTNYSAYAHAISAKRGIV